ncbi:hypothetical protein HOLleu_06923 [Holothuria leucospilota]|uniref:Uncharacterized protein n=1 Tax=Holothuria leucospilota TaxID=206669 RepID=A0A9Q1HID7_HOLLE|nr:hypothetical protein HOLleu_06923 [Holothuria leucospilota]
MESTETSQDGQTRPDESNTKESDGDDTQVNPKVSTSTPKGDVALQRSPEHWVTLDDIKAAEELKARSDVDKGSRHSSGSVSRHSSMVSRNPSSASFKLKEARAKQELANLKKQQLERRHSLEKEKQEFERRLELMALREEQECADTEAKFWQGEVGLELENGGVSDRNRGVAMQGEDRRHTTQPASNWRIHTEPAGNLDRAQGTNGRVPQGQLDPLAEEWTGYNLHASAGGETGPATTGSFDCKGVGLGIGTQSPDMLNLMSTIEYVNLPKPELIYFDGSPEKYWPFIYSFRSNIEGKPINDRAKLTYLIQFCTGIAKESIENCILMNPPEGLKKAKLILANQFGTNHEVTHALLEKVLQRDPIGPNDSEGLRELARVMRKCEITLNELGQVANMNSSDTLLKVQKLLPLRLQGEWAKRAWGIMQMKMEPKFSNMADFIEQASQVACNVFGKNIGRGKQPQVQQKPKPNQGHSTKGNRVTTLVGKGQQGRRGEDNSNTSEEKCLSCKAPHKLNECRQFKQMDLKERLQFVRQRKLCNNCLLPNHFAKGCIVAPRCTVAGCKGKHDALIHIPNMKGRRDNRNSSDEQQTPDSPTWAGTETSSVSNNQQGTNCNTSVGNQKVCFRAVPVKVQGNKGDVETWALLDNASDVTLCDQRLLDSLGLKGKETSFSLNTVVGEGQEQGVEVSLIAKALNGDGTVHLPRVWSVKGLPIDESNLPSVSDVKRWSHLRDLEFPGCKENHVLLLIGSDVPEAFWVMDERRVAGRNLCHKVTPRLGSYGPSGSAGWQ